MAACTLFHQWGRMFHLLERHGTVPVDNKLHSIKILTVHRSFRYEVQWTNDHRTIILKMYSQSQTTYKTYYTCLYCFQIVVVGTSYQEAFRVSLGEHLLSYAVHIRWLAAHFYRVINEARILRRALKEPQHLRSSCWSPDFDWQPSLLDLNLLHSSGRKL